MNPATGLRHFEAPAHRSVLDEWLCRRILAGWRPAAVAAAAGGSVSVRTIYRWRKELVGLETIELGEYRAPFALRRSGPPVRIGEWRR